MAWWDGGEDVGYDVDPYAGYYDDEYDLSGLIDYSGYGDVGYSAPEYLQNYIPQEAYQEPPFYAPQAMQMPEATIYQPEQPMVSSREAFEDQRIGEREMQPGQEPKPESPLTKAMNAGGRMLKGATESPGRSMQALTGLGGLAMIGAGLAAKKPSVDAKGRPMTPQEQAAANTLRQRTAALAGDPASRGYAGEEGIRKTVNEQLQANLEGNMELASPATVRALNEQRTMLVENLRRDLGPGAFSASGAPLATAAQNALKNFDIKMEAILNEERRQARAQLNTMGMQRSGFARELELDPSRAAGNELSLLSGIGSQDAALRFGADQANAANESADRRALLQTGGQFAGMAVAPWMYQQMLESLPRRA